LPYEKSSDSRTITVEGLVGPLAKIVKVVAPAYSEPGVTFEADVVVENAGTEAGDVWVQIADLEDGMPGQRASVPIQPGAQTNVLFSLTMPNKVWKLSAQAGTDTDIESSMDFTVSNVPVPELPLRLKLAGILTTTILIAVIAARSKD
jgi:hypothetical protein